MASPYNTTDQMNSQTNSNASGAAGTQFSKTAQTTNIADANETAEQFDPSQAPDWKAASQPETSGKAEKSSARTQSSQKSQGMGRQASSQGQQQARQVQPRQSASQQNDESATGVDVLKGSLSNAFDQIVKEIEPQINEFATGFAHQAIAKGEDFGRQAIKRVQGQSWGRIALAGALIVGAVAVLGYQAAEAISDSDSLH